MSILCDLMYPDIIIIFFLLVKIKIISCRCHPLDFTVDDLNLMNYDQIVMKK